MFAGNQQHSFDRHSRWREDEPFVVHRACAAGDARQIPFGPHRTPAEEVAFLRKQMIAADQQLPDPAQRAEFKAEIERLIADIEAGRRRVGDND